MQVLESSTQILKPILHLLSETNVAIFTIHVNARKDTIILKYLTDL